MLTKARELSPAAENAVKRYAKDFETVHGGLPTMAKVSAAERLRQARAVVLPQEVAVLDQMAGRGWKLSKLAGMTGRKSSDLWALYAGAGDKLAAYFAHLAAGEG